MDSTLPLEIEKPPVHVEVEQPGNGSWKSRKFWSATGSAFAVLAYSGAARWFDKISEESLEYLITASLVSIAIYCGYNIAEKLGGIGAMFGLGKKK